MLVLTRAEGEDIVLRDEAGGIIGTVGVASIRGAGPQGGGRVRLTFQFPPTVRIDRIEVDELRRARTCPNCGRPGNDVERHACPDCGEPFPSGRERRPRRHGDTEVAA